MAQAEAEAGDLFELDENNKTRSDLNLFGFISPKSDIKKDTKRIHESMQREIDQKHIE